MKPPTGKILATFSIVAVFAAGFLSRDLVNLSALASASKDNAQTAASRKCALKTVKGAYGIKFDGQKIGTGPLASVSRIVFDGEGTFTTTETGTFNGNPLQRTFTGPYTVNDDCTGFLDFSSNLTGPHPVHGDFVIVDEGREFFLVDSSNGWSASGIGKKI